MGQKYKFSFHPKKLGGAGDHGILFGYDTSKFQVRDQVAINFFDQITGEDHNQNAVCTKLQKLANEKKKDKSEEKAEVDYSALAAEKIEQGK